MNRTDILDLLPSLKDLTEVSEAAFVALDLPEKKVRKRFPFAEMEDGLYRVREERMVVVREGLAKLSKKADKLGVPAPTIEEVRVEELPLVVEFQNPRSHTWDHSFAITREIRRFYVVRPCVDPVRLPDYAFVATIEHLGEEGNLLRTSPSFEGKLPVAYRSDSPTCDHCKTFRRRNETFVLQHKDGSFRRVGRNCLAAFLGGKSAEDIVQAANIEASLLALCEDPEGGEGGYYSGGARRVEPTAFLSVVALAIQEVGWLSRKAARESYDGKASTADTAWAAIFPPPGRRGPPILDSSAVTDAHREDAKAALLWAQAIPQDVERDYLYNIRIIAHQPSWTFKESGLGAAILMSYQKEQERLKRMEFERRLPSVHLGEVGQRFGKKPSAPLKARVLGVHSFEGNYGVTTIVRMQTAIDDVSVADLVWFGSGCVNAKTGDYAAAAVELASASKGMNEAQAKHYALDRESPDSANVWNAYMAARAVHEEAHARLQRAERPVKAGDLVEVTGSVKKHETSQKTKRKETVLTRCSLTLIEEDLAEAK